MVTEIALNAASVGTVLSPVKDGFLVTLQMTRSQWPAHQSESCMAVPYPFGRWTAGRFVLRDQGGSRAGPRRILNFAAENGGGCATGNTLFVGMSFRYVGELFLECLPKNQEWLLTISDIPITKAA